MSFPKAQPFKIGNAKNSLNTTQSFFDRQRDKQLTTAQLKAAKVKKVQ